MVHPVGCCRTWYLLVAKQRFIKPSRIRSKLATGKTDKRTKTSTVCLRVPPLNATCTRMSRKTAGAEKQKMGSHHSRFVLICQSTCQTHPSGRSCCCCVVGHRLAADHHWQDEVQCGGGRLVGNATVVLATKFKCGLHRQSGHRDPTPPTSHLPRWCEGCTWYVPK